MTKSSGGSINFKVLLDNQATLYVFKKNSLVSNIRAKSKARTIGGIDGRRPGMSTEQIFDIPHVRVG